MTETFATVVSVDIIQTNPQQVCVTYSDGKMVVMYKSDWDRQNQ